MDSVSSILALMVFLCLNFGAAASGALFRPGEWYERLVKPRWLPPNWVFAPVWSVLYVMIGVAGWLVWRRCGFADLRSPLTIYAVQLLLNAAWPCLFFGLRRPGLALGELTALWIAILWTMVAFFQVAAVPAMILAPYFLWVSFAAALNLWIWRFNRAPTSARGRA